jgi:hypothetical protein
MAEVQNRLNRETETRAKYARPTAWQEPSVYPEPDHRPGWAHRYVRISLLGSSDPSNISLKLREGYEPCKAEDYPELMVHAAVDGRFKGNIEVGGLLLCRIPEEFMVQRESHFAKKSRQQMESVDNTFLRQSDPKMPLFAERKSQVTFGSGS